LVSRPLRIGGGSMDVKLLGGVASDELLLGINEDRSGPAPLRFKCHASLEIDFSRTALSAAAGGVA